MRALPHYFLHQTTLSLLLLSMMGFIVLPANYRINFPPEICDNALDDDGDGLIDLHDPDCACEIVEPVSLIPNPSFEDMKCCPESQSQLNCADVWIQASEPTTDFIHMCDWMGWPDFPPPLPFPDGEGIMGFRDGRVRGDFSEPEYNWKEYAGACLLSPLLKDTPYIFEFYVGFVNRCKSPDINITFFGTSDCSNLPFGIGDDDFGCPTNGPGWVRLGSRYVSGGAGNKWVKTTIEVTPEENIAAIAIGPDCPPVTSPISIYYFFDNLTLVDLRSFQFQITTQTHPCSSEFTLSVAEQSGFSYQWYKDGIALIGETSSALIQPHGEGLYQVRVSNAGSCALSGGYLYTIPMVSASVAETICEGDAYPFGSRMLTVPGQYIDTFKTIDQCDSIVHLELKVLGIETDTMEAKMFEGETYEIENYRFKEEGEYPVQLTSSQGCDSLLLLQLSFYQIYIPNVFSPNGDGINDYFSIFGGIENLETYAFTIYDKWGNQLFAGTQWDGRRKGEVVHPGVYTYMLTAAMDDGIERTFTGDVTLVR